MTAFYPFENLKNLRLLSEKLLGGTSGQTRTDTSIQTLDFESDASTIPPRRHTTKDIVTRFFLKSRTI